MILALLLDIDKLFFLVYVTAPWHRSLSRSVSNSSMAVENDAKDSDKYGALLALAHERTITMKSQLSREESRVRELERCIDEHVTSKKALLSEIETKKMENNFLEAECRMLRDMVEDFRLRVRNLEGGVGERIIREVREADDYSSEEDSCTADNSFDVGVLQELSSLGNEIMRTGTVSASDEYVKPLDGNQDIFDRLTNPSNFTGTQKNIFEKEVESNRAKVLQIKEGHRRKRDDVRPGAIHQSSEDGDELDTNSHTIESTSVDSTFDDSLSINSSQLANEKRSRGPSAEKLHSINADRVHPVAQNSRQSTPPSGNHSKDTGNVFSRLANPSKYTGIHRRKQHLPESPGSPGVGVAIQGIGDDNKLNSSTFSRSSRRLRSHSIDRADSVASADVDGGPPKDRDKHLDDASARRRISDSNRSKSTLEREKERQHKSPSKS